MKKQNTKTAVNTASTTATVKDLPRLKQEQNTPQRPIEKITFDNIELYSEIIALRALLTNYAKSSMPYMYELYIKLVKDINENKKTLQPLSEAYDIASEVKEYLYKYIGKNTTDENTDGEKNKDGTTADIWRSAFRIANRYIIKEKRKVYKCVYVDEIDENGNTLYYEIPQEWDIDSATDYKTITAIINALKLSVNEMRFIKYRLRGKSHKDIAKTMGITEGSVKKYQQRIREKAKNRPEIAPYIEKLQAK